MGSREIQTVAVIGAGPVGEATTSRYNSALLDFMVGNAIAGNDPRAFEVR